MRCRKMNAYEKLQKKLLKVYQEENKSKNRDVFSAISKPIEKYIFSLSNQDYLNILERIGVLPEYISTDSSQEKTFSKVSDIVYARGISEIGLKSKVLTERANAADIVGCSKYFNYSLVGDSKVSRLSRTARNQKDFKTAQLNRWRKNHTFAALCAPYFDYPVRYSQVYRDAIYGNVTLFSWEYLIFLIKNNIRESQNCSLKPIWEYSCKYREINFPNINFNSGKIPKGIDNIARERFLDKQTYYISNYIRKYCKPKKFISFANILKSQRQLIIKEAQRAITYWDNQLESIKTLSRSKAINRLIKIEKHERNQKVKYINNYLRRINNAKWDDIFRKFQ